MHRLLAITIIVCLLPALAPAGAPPAGEIAWRVRDAATGQSPAPQIELNTQARSGDAAAQTATVIDKTGRERAIVLEAVVAGDLAGWTWWDDPQTSRPITGDGVFANLVQTQCGADGQASRYPLAVISSEDRAFCIAVPPMPARMVRFSYDPKSNELVAAFDFGLSPICEHFKSRADASVITFELPPGPWAFRRALANYHALFPEVFQRRVEHGGTWLPFGDIRSIEKADDFGFRYHELGEDPASAAGGQQIAADHALGCGSYPYVEPQTYWQDYYGGDADHADYDERHVQLKKDAAAGVAAAQSTLVSGIERADGRLDLYLDPIAYTKLAPWGNSADPAIPPDPDTGWLGRGPTEIKRLATLAGLRDKPSTGIDGVYVDSLEGWGQIIDYDKDHWRVSRSPLTFDPETKRIGLWNFWGTYWFVRDLSGELRSAKGRKLALFGNDAFFRYWFMVPFIDVPGREYTWIDKDGRFTPVDDAQYLFIRAMCAGRPYLMLMNNNYDRGEFMEPYFQRSLFFGVFPSFFRGHASMTEVPYFANGDWYNRDRPLFARYLPMIHRLDEAGWEPVPAASAAPKEIRIERFGRMPDKNLAFTVHNPTGAAQSVTLLLDRAALSLPEKITAREWIAGKVVAIDNGDAGAFKLRLDLAPRAYAAIGIEEAE